MAPQVIVVNGGSSSGTTSIVRQLQALLVEPWLAASIDDFVDSLPPTLQQSADGFSVRTDGTVQVGDVFTRLEGAWMAGIAATARAGAPVVVDDVFLGAAASQARWRAALTDLTVAFVGVRCDPDVATLREARRPDRDAGMAALQAWRVHEGVVYDVQVDSSRRSAQDCARRVAVRLGLPCSTAVPPLAHQAVHPERSASTSAAARVHAAPPELGLRLAAVTLDCDDVDRVAGFWSALLGLPLRRPLPGWQRLGPVAGGPLLTFQPVDPSEGTRPTVHVDLTTTDGPGAVRRVLQLGGSLLEEHRYDEGVVRVVADPEGHVLCLVQYAEGCSPA